MNNGDLTSLNNGDLLEVVRLSSLNPFAADLLKHRWESFWENDYRTLARQRTEIDRLTLQLEQIREEARRSSHDRSSLIREIRRENQSLKIKHGRLQHTPKGKLQTEINLLKDQLGHEKRRAELEITSLTRQLAAAKDEIIGLHKTLEFYERRLNRTPRTPPMPKLRDSIQVVPPFEALPQEGSLVIARQVRILSQ